MFKNMFLNSGRRVQTYEFIKIYNVVRFVVYFFDLWFSIMFIVMSNQDRALNPRPLCKNKIKKVTLLNEGRGMST